MSATHTVTLEHGFIDAKQNQHKEITFGHRLNGLDLITVDKMADLMGQSASKFLILAAAITKFGELPESSFVEALLSLDDLDVEEVAKGYDAFLQLRESKPEILSDTSLKLTSYIEVEEKKYNVVTLGNPLNGFAYLRADKLRLTGIGRTLYLIGQQVSKLSTDDGQSEKATQLTHKDFYGLDSDDIFTLKQVSDNWMFKRRLDAHRESANVGDETEDNQQSEAVN